MFFTGCVGYGAWNPVALSDPLGAWLAGYAGICRGRGDDVECRKQGRRAVAHIVMGHSLRVAQAHGQHRLGAVQYLYLRLFVYTQHHGLVRRMEVQADNVADLLDKARIVGQLERALSVRLHAEQVEPPLDGAFRHARLRRHAPPQWHSD